MIALVALAVPAVSAAAIPPVEVENCATVNRVAVDEVVQLELGGLGAEPEELVLVCDQLEVSVRVTIGSQALLRELDLSELPVDDRERFVGLNIVEMVEILQGRTARVEPSEPVPLVAPAELYAMPPAVNAPDEPLQLGSHFGVYALAHYQLGYDAPFAGVAAAYELRTSQGFGAAVDLQLGFRTLEIANTDEAARMTSLALGLQSQWWPTERISVGPGIRFGGVMATRGDTDAREFAYWGGLFAASGVHFPLFASVDAQFGLEVGYSPWTYRVVAEANEAVRMRGLFTSAYFGANWH